jgi:hypothetical protein
MGVLSLDRSRRDFARGHVVRDDSEDEQVELLEVKARGTPRSILTRRTPNPAG